MAHLSVSNPPPHVEGDFPLDSSGNPASWIPSQSFWTSLSEPFISWIRLLFSACYILLLCDYLRLCSSPSWQIMHPFSFSFHGGDHIMRGNLLLLLSNLKISEAAVCISQSHIETTEGIYIYKLFLEQRAHNLTEFELESVKICNNELTTPYPSIGNNNSVR